MESDLYAVLGVSADSEDVVIQAAYRALMRRYHPDTNNSPSAQQKAQGLNHAYSILGNPEERATYDRQRENNSAGGKASESAPPSPPPQPPPSPTNAAPHSQAADTPQPVGAAWLALLAFLGLTLVVWAVASFNTYQRDALFSAEEGQATPEAAGDASPTSAPGTPPENQTDVATSVNPSASSDEQPVPTMGQFSDRIDIAVEKFAEIYRKNGFAGAQRYSKACEDAALVSSDILETDFCVAFDLSAILVSFALQESTGTPRDPYFDGRVAGIVESQYTRYPQAHPGRKDIIWNEVRERLPKALESADQ